MDSSTLIAELIKNNKFEVHDSGKAYIVCDSFGNIYNEWDYSAHNSRWCTFWDVIKQLDIDGFTIFWIKSKEEREMKSETETRTDIN